MEVIFEPEAEEDLKQVNSDHSSFIKQKITELGNQPTAHPASDIIRVKGRQVYKYVMKKGSKG